MHSDVDDLIKDFFLFLTRPTAIWTPLVLVDEHQRRDTVVAIRFDALLA